MCRVPPRFFAARLHVATAWAGLLWCFCLLGCDGPSARIALGPLPPRPVFNHPDEDGGIEAPEGSKPCKSDADCDDGVDCTTDACLPGGYCESRTDPSRCSDGLVCNGVETCDPKLGCISAPPPSCDDQDPCTIDHCDEDAKSCVHDSRDFDHDGEADDHCPGGTDCDDFDPTRGMNAREICGDGVDNDCDGAIDEADCGAVLHDTCVDPLDISAGGVFEVGVVGAVSDYPVSCADGSAAGDRGAARDRDVVFTFQLDEPRDVKLVAQGVLGGGGQDNANINLLSSCGSGVELQCAHGFPGDLRVRALPAGRYYVTASVGVSARSVIVTASFSAATKAPTNQSCESALDVGKGGHFTSDFVGVSDTTLASCAIKGQPDLYYKITLAEQKDVVISAIGNESKLLVMSLRKGCAEEQEIGACEMGARMTERFHQLDPGDYTLVLQGPSTSAIGFALDVNVTDPTPPPVGDSCNEPIALTLGMSQRVSLVGLLDDVASSCQKHGPDAVLTLAVEDTQDLDFKIDGSDSAPVTMALQTECGELLSERTCRIGGPLTTRLHDVPAGHYFMVVDSPTADELMVQVDALPPTPPTSVMGNDTCETAFEIPITGGLFKGDTRQLSQDYTSNSSCGNGALSRDAAYKLTLPSRKHVVVSVDASFDSVLLRYDSPGPGEALCSEAMPACNDDGNGMNAQFDEPLDAGTYYYIVDGYSSTNAGEYVLDVSISDP